MKTIIAAVFLMVWIQCFGASPTFNSFNSNQFIVNPTANSISINTAILTNSGSGIVTNNQGNSASNFFTISGTNTSFVSGNYNAGLAAGQLVITSNAIIGGNFSVASNITSITGVFNGNGSGLFNVPVAASNITGIVPIANGGTSTNTAQGAEANIGVYPLVSDFAVSNIAAGSFVGQLGMSSNGILARWDGVSWFALLGFQQPPSIGSQSNMLVLPFNGNGKVYWQWGGYTNCSGTNTNYLATQSGPVIVNWNPYGPGSGMWFSSVHTNGGAPGATFGDDEFLFIGATSSNAWVGFSPGYAQATPDVNGDFLITSPIGFTGEDTSIAPFNHPVLATDFSHYALRIPYATINATTPKASTYQDLAYFNGKTGEIMLTNIHCDVEMHSIYVDTNNPRVNTTNKEKGIEFHGGEYHDTLNDAAIFDVESGGTPFGRFAIGDPPAQGPAMVHDNTWPFVIGRANQTGLFSGWSGMTFIEEARSDANGFQVEETLTAPAIVASNAFQLISGGGSGLVLTSDSTGHGTWQAASGGSAQRHHE